jgi:hypothetical protein
VPQYAILLYSPAPADIADIPKEEMDAQINYGSQIGEMGGTMTSPMALQPSTTATSIRGDVVTDGPFIESKEVLAGLFVLEATDLDQALAIAKKCPATWRGGVEVRPLLGPPGA